MRFSVIAGPRQRSDLGQTAPEAWRTFVDDAVFAEELGFDAIYFGEHHFCYASGNSSPLVMLAEVAARTKRIRVGTSVICAPFHNPLRLAEDIAAVDIVSNGRFDLGIGVGSQWEEFQAFHIDPKERFGRTWEIIDIIEKCLNSKQKFVSHEGKYYSFPEIEWTQQIVQDRIPIFWGGFGPQGVKRAAERGYNLIAPDYSGVYQRTMAEHGRRAEDHLIGFVTVLSVADSWQQAMDGVAEPCTWVSNQYALRKDLDGNQPPESARYEVADIVAATRAGRIGEFLPEPGAKPAPFSVPVVGVTDDMLDYFLKVVRGEKGLITHIGLSFREPGVQTEHVRNGMRLFAEKVLPVLREEAARRGL